MALPASPPLNMLQILAEYGAPAGTGLLAMARGGSWVPNTAGNAGVPTGPQIGVLSFLGANSGGGSPLTATIDGVFSNIYLNEPAPASQSVSGGTTVFASGGTGGPYTYSWAFLSGFASFTFTNGGTPAGRVPTWQASVPKNSTRAGVWRCTIGDGLSTIFRDASIDLGYYTDL